MPACSVCNLYLNSPEQMQQHLAGKAHAKKVKAVAKLEADAAAKTETAVNAEALRINEVTSQSVTGSDTAASHANTSNTEPPSQQFCDTCKVMLNSPEQAHQHYQGARHAKRLKLVVKGPRNDGATPGESESDPHHGFFFCSFCNVYVNSVQQMTIHREGSKHKKMVEAKKRAAEEQSLDMQPPTKTPKIDRGQTVSGRGQTVSGRDKLFLAGDKLFLAGDKLFLPEDKLFLPEGKILLATEETSLLVAEGKALLLGEAKTLLRLHQSP
ncbi:hypothetical protein C0Q70_08109 [Pomacea canaliculata]|uniref:Matrin-type domain-containing protein n=1 Tax=Pomacea canaliculata TaxID=400727 RepID=A0A2T7PGW9_POMCA|nr:zinc finger protein 346-like isoform X2 [Pomacea canaliculata]PVD32664.1 hypothetical protein C0Q70_08109 [Pomacea canaliculata]